MYEFVDTIEMQEGALSLPAEAVQINGQWLENAVSGYRTLNVSGREIVDVKIQDTSYVTKNGSYFIGEKIEPRILKITYQLLADSAADYRDAFNQLLGILHSGELTVIFNDEDDKYFKGYLYAMEEPNAGSNKITGSFSIYCPDPLKYSIEETVVEVTPDNGDEIEIEYEGTEKTYPVIEVVANSPLGWIKLFKDNKKLLLGNGDVQDISDVGTNIFEKKFGGLDSDFYEASRFNEYPYSGSLTAGGEYVSLGGRLEFDTSNIPVFSSGYYGMSYTYDWSNPSADFEFSTSFRFGALNNVFNGNLGFLQLNFWSNSLQKYILSVTIEGSNSEYYIYIKIYDENVGWHGYPFLARQSAEVISITIEKRNGITSLTWKNAGETGPSGVWSFSNHQEDMKLAHADCISFCCGATGLYKNNYRCYLGAATLNSNAIDGYENVINQGDDVVADCANANVYVNGAMNDGYGALQNDWEDFSLSAGSNSIIANYLDDVEEPPTVKIKYKEAYL